MIDHPSQRDHLCLLFTELECLEQYFVFAFFPCELISETLLFLVYVSII